MNLNIFNVFKNQIARILIILPVYCNWFSAFSRDEQPKQIMVFYKTVLCMQINVKNQNKAYDYVT